MTQKERKERSRQEIFCAALDVQDVSTAVKAYFMLREQFFQSRPRHKRIFETAMLRPPEHLRNQIQALHEPLRSLNSRFLSRVAAHMPLRAGLSQEQVTQYLGSIEELFYPIMARYRGQQPPVDLHSMLDVAEQLLDKPGVLTVLPGIRSLEDMKEALAWLDASPEERDYSVLGTFTPKDVTGTCVYCNHCAPCPAGLNIGLINKYYDLAKIGDAMAADHYAKLEKHASGCISCGHCDSRCPFHVRQADRMKRIAGYFGR